MGANEKYEAAMHGAKFTPDADAVESAYIQHRSHQVTLIEAHHEFNRAIEKIKAEAKAEALRDLADTGLESKKISKFQAAWIRGLAREYTQGPHKNVGAFATPETNKENQS